MLQFSKIKKNRFQFKYYTSFYVSKIVKINNILCLTAGLILTVLIFLFLHSELPLFENHSENCKDVDICLILEKANFDNDLNFDNFHKISYEIVLIPILKISQLLHMSEEFDSFLPKHLFYFPDNLHLKNKILLI